MFIFTLFQIYLLFRILIFLKKVQHRKKFKIHKITLTKFTSLCHCPFHLSRLNAKGFYLLIYSITLNTSLLSSLHIQLPHVSSLIKRCSCFFHNNILSDLKALNVNECFVEVPICCSAKPSVL